jgi:hypothetical protein
MFTSCDTAVTSCAGANGLVSMMLFGTPKIGRARRSWFFLAGLLRDLPAIEPALQTDVGHQRPVRDKDPIGLAPKTVVITE